MKVLVAMSGGVDSSVAALLLKQHGYDAVGVSMNLLTCSRAGDASCCTANDRRDARAVCAKLGMPYEVLDFRSRFREKVIAPFIEEYLSGRTPSPCILCNEHLKFNALFEEADRLGAELIATGHYARIERVGDAYKFYHGRDLKKDQSYFLFMLKQKDLARLIFPLGDLTKDEVRRVATKAGLRNHEKPESQEICFIPDDNYAAFIEAEAGTRIRGRGDFVDMDGNLLGRHDGIHAYTIGQRRGLGFGIGRRQYVVRIDPKRNQVVLGSEEDLRRKSMLVKDISWVNEDRSNCSGIMVKIRSAHTGAIADLGVIDDGAIPVIFHEPVSGIAPGQAAVFYDGDEVLGGGWIL